MKVYLDDLRKPPEGWILAETAPEAISLLNTGTVTEISLDHDLGLCPEVGTGYDVLLWIEEQQAKSTGFRIPKIHIHTANSGARGRMESARKAIEMRDGKE